MVESELGQFAECWKQACEGAGKEPSINAIEWAFEVLKDKSLDEIKRALIAHARHPQQGQFVPKAADVIREIEGSPEDKKNAGIVAWARVKGNLDRYSSVIYDDPAIHYAIAVGFDNDWQKVCDYDDSKFECQASQRAFIAAYTSYKKGMNYPPRIQGIHELGGANWKKNTKIVGDVEQAKAVMYAGSHAGIAALDVGKTMRGIESVVKGIEE